MKWKEHRSNIINLGFEENDIFEESEKHLIESTNRALIFLNSFVERKTKVVKVTLPDSEDYQLINLRELEGFDSVSQIPPKIKGKPVGDYYYENDELYIKSTGEQISITFNSKSELIPSNVDDEFEIEIKMELIPLLQLLTAYYVWLDDDERKAVYYYNQYQENVNIYFANKDKESRGNISATVEGGINI